MPCLKENKIIQTESSFVFPRIPSFSWVPNIETSKVICLCIVVIVTSSATDKKLEIDKKNLENKLEIFEFFVNGT